MPDLVEQMYCAEQIHIPPTFPYILKQYAKAAIRTQPYDLLRWSAAYFRAMANGDEPPVKVRLEYPPTELPSGLTPGYLKVLLKQFKGKIIVPPELLNERWLGVCLNENALREMLKLGDFGEEVDFLKFIAIAAGHLTNSLSQTMVLVCELLTEEPEGGSAMIPCDVFCNLYAYLARLNCGPPGDETEERKGADQALQENKEVEEGENEEKKGEEGDKTGPVEPTDTSIATEENDETTATKDAQDRTEDGATSEVSMDAEEDETQEIDGEDKQPNTAAIEGRPGSGKQQARRRQFAVEVQGIGPVVPEEQIDSVVTYMKYWAARQEGMVMPRNIRHFLCPRLDPDGTAESLEPEK